MSALGQKLISTELIYVRIHPKADIQWRVGHVR
jgi:hypothetical protein